MADIDHIVVEFPEETQIDHFDVDQPDQEQPVTVEIDQPPDQITVNPTGEDIQIKSFVIESIGPPGPQGPQGIPGPPGQAFNIVGESPSGIIDGANKIFTTAMDFMADTLAVFLNGLRQEEVLDYTIPDTNAFQMNDSPLEGDRLRVDYLTQL